MNYNPVVTTEKTGKEIKLGLLLSGIGVVGGMALSLLFLGCECPGAAVGSLVVMGISSIAHFYYKILRWWRYE